MEGKGGGKTSVLCAARLFVNGQIISKFQSVYHYDKGETLLNFYCTSLRICTSIISFLLRPPVHYKVSMTLLLAPEIPALPRFQRTDEKKRETLSLSLFLLLRWRIHLHTCGHLFLQTYSFEWSANQLMCVWPTVWGVQVCVWPLRVHDRHFKQAGGWQLGLDRYLHLHIHTL